MHYVILSVLLLTLAVVSVLVAVEYKHEIHEDLSNLKIKLRAILRWATSLKK